MSSMHLSVMTAGGAPRGLSAPPRPTWMSALAYWSFLASRMPCSFVCTCCSSSPSPYSANAYFRPLTAGACGAAADGLLMHCQATLKVIRKAAGTDAVRDGTGLARAIAHSSQGTEQYAVFPLWVRSSLGEESLGLWLMRHLGVGDERPRARALGDDARGEQLRCAAEPHDHPVVHVPPVGVARHDAAAGRHDQAPERHQLLSCRGRGRFAGTRRARLEPGSARSG